MESKLIEIKAGAVAVLSAMGLFLGWKGVLAVAWAAAMALDYISGTCAACKTGEWSSAVARDGLWHKGGMILVVVVSAIADSILALICANMPAMGISWPGLVMPMVLSWYILTEMGSVLENAVKLGAPVPAWLIKFLKISLKAVDDHADPAAPAE